MTKIILVGLTPFIPSEIFKIALTAVALIPSISKNFIKKKIIILPMKIGIDLGGTKTEGILIDASGNELTRKRINTEKNYRRNY